MRKQDRTKVRNGSEIDLQTREVFLSLCEQVNSPASLKAYLLMKYKQEKDLLDIKVRALDYTNADAFGKDYLIQSFLSKWVGLQTGIDTKAAALTAWKASELKCSATNARFLHSANAVKSALQPILHRVQVKIANVLGDLRTSECFELSRWGPGATFDVSRRGGLDTKISKALTVTSPALRYAQIVLSADPVWYESITGQRPTGPFSALSNCFTVVRGSKSVTVPKNAKIDRWIACEPTANGFLQAGVGRFIRRCLSRVGVRLSDQGVNQRLAARAATCHLATLDLKAASDTIARALIYDLLPFDWAFFLDSLRSRETFIDGAWCPLEKFSSMGNGFTFELETLIFWAISVSVCEAQNVDHRDKLAVYGDDLIIPREAVPLAIDTLEECGFEVNMDKSFWDGPFFESCGKHYYAGHDVTPAYQKRLITSTAETIRTHNRILRWEQRVCESYGGRLTAKACRNLRRYTEAELKGEIPRIPYGSTGDDGFLTPRKFWESEDLNHGYLCSVLVYSEKKRLAADLPLFANKLRNPGTLYDYRSRKGGGGVTLPTGSGIFKMRKRFVKTDDRYDTTCPPNTFVDFQGLRMGHLEVTRDEIYLEALQP